MERAAPGFPIWPCTRWGFPCLRACAWSGGLLPHLFTLTAGLAPGGGMFSVALSVGTPRGVTSRVYPRPDLGYAASRPAVFGLSSPGRNQERFSALPKPWGGYAPFEPIARRCPGNRRSGAEKSAEPWFSRPRSSPCHWRSRGCARSSGRRRSLRPPGTAPAIAPAPACGNRRRRRVPRRRPRCRLWI